MSVEKLFDGIEVGISTTQPDALVAFYGGFLGLEDRGELAFDGGTQRRFGFGPNTIKIVSYDQAPAARPTPGGGAAQEGIRYLSLGAANMAAVVSEAEAQGIEVAVPPTQAQGFEGFGFCFLVDPDGNWVELFGPI